jgi:hypothetical protein
MEAAHSTKFVTDYITSCNISFLHSHHHQNIESGKRENILPFSVQWRAYEVLLQMLNTKICIQASHSNAQNQIISSLPVLSRTHDSPKFWGKYLNIYRIFWPTRHTFFPENCDLNLTCVLCTEGKYYFQTYKCPYIYYTTSLSWDSEICFQIIRAGITACEGLTFSSRDLP